MPATAKPSFCATCTEVRSDLAPCTSVAGATVWLCPDCHPEVDTGRPRELHGVERGYEVPVRDFATMIRNVAQSAPGGMLTPSRYCGRTVTPGCQIERVARDQRGKTLSREEALELLRGEPWFAELRHVGSDARYHIFERPAEPARNAGPESK